MTLSEIDLKKIIARRDPRYDGRFYFGVKTTKIYCRPVCPARPNPKNILVFRSLSEAEKSGFRPCLRCRPDKAPGSKFFEEKGTGNTVSRALLLMEEVIGDDLNVPFLAEALGVTDRHLRRLFDEHLGASPIEILQTKRLHLAKEFLLETSAPVTQIAFAVGFQSLRRFNEAFKNLYQQSPSEIRKKMRGKGRDKEANHREGFSLSLMIRQPFDWKTTLAYLKRHEAIGIERVDDQCYWRFLPHSERRAGRTDNGPYGDSFRILKVELGPKMDRLLVTLIGFQLVELRPTLCKLKRLFDTEHNPKDLPVEKGWKADGIRVPGCFDPFEVAVSIILSQLVSTKQAKKKLQDLILRFGKKIGHDQDRDDEIFAFPNPEDLLKAPLEELGLPRIKAHAIRELARMIGEGELSFSVGLNGDFDKVRQILMSIKGIGPWTTEMIMMRCFGDGDAFPRGDLIIQRALESGVVDEGKWVSSRAYLTHFLWKNFGESLSKVKMKKNKVKVKEKVKVMIKTREKRLGLGIGKGGKA